MTDDLDNALTRLADEPVIGSLDLHAIGLRAGRRRSRRRVLLGGLGLVLVATAVPATLAVTSRSGQDTVGPTVAAADSSPPAAGPDAVPYQPATAPMVFRDRPVLTSCGSFLLRNTAQGLTREPASARQCLVDAAAAGTGAELAVATPTVEGDPVVTYRRVLPGGGSETFVDATADRYGSGRWTFTSCATASDSEAGCRGPQPLLAVTADTGACPDGDTGLADYVDFLQVGGEMYTGVQDPAASTHLGPTVLQVHCELSTGARSGPLRSGDAAYVPAGTPVRQVDGFDPRLRLAVQRDGGIQLYENMLPAGARNGLEALPGVAQRVRSLVLLSVRDGVTEVGRISDPTAVAELAQDVQAAQLDPASVKGGGFQLDLFVGLVLDDGSRVIRAYDSRTGVLLPGLRMPAHFREVVAAARR